LFKFAAGKKRFKSTAIDAFKSLPDQFHDRIDLIAYFFAAAKVKVKENV
jgi:hypothetical protein